MVESLGMDVSYDEAKAAMMVSVVGQEGVRGRVRGLLVGGVGVIVLCAEAKAAMMVSVVGQEEGVKQRVGRGGGQRIRQGGGKCCMMRLKQPC